jgi:N-acetyl-gamma-glutamyl-phosphate reductase
MKTIKIGIAGAAGYTGGELLRILINHPLAEIIFLHSNSNAGKLASDVHADLLGDTDLKFTDSISQNIDVLFLCVGHGDAKKFLDANPVNESVKIIDLSQDFRLRKNSVYSDRKFVYGLPELNRESIRKANNIANPGCFATCIQLGLLPLVASGNLSSEVHINATTGSTGAGQSPGPTTHFSWRNNNLSIYKPFEHQHLNEIGESLLSLQQSFSNELSFVPQRGDFTRGILAAMYLECDLTLDEAQKIYNDYYESHPFSHLSQKSIDLKQVVNTNKALVYLEKHGNKLFIVSIIDNLLKGASGQAVQNMNLMFGVDEMMGLKLKASAF